MRSQGEHEEGGRGPRARRLGRRLSRLGPLGALVMAGCLGVLCGPPRTVGVDEELPERVLELQPVSHPSGNVVRVVAATKGRRRAARTGGCQPSECGDLPVLPSPAEVRASTDLYCVLPGAGGSPLPEAGRLKLAEGATRSSEEEAVADAARFRTEHCWSGDGTLLAVRASPPAGAPSEWTLVRFAPERAWAPVMSSAAAPCEAALGTSQSVTWFPL